MSIGANIKTIREAAKLTQSQLADRLFISRTTLSGYENGKPFNPEMVMKICAALQTDPNHLFGVHMSIESEKERFIQIELRKLEEMYEELK